MLKISKSEILPEKGKSIECGKHREAIKTANNEEGIEEENSLENESNTGSSGSEAACKNLNY